MMNDNKYGIKSSYQLNSIIFDILNEFNAANDETDEKSYMTDLLQFANDYLLHTISDETALDIIFETFNAPEDYFIMKFGPDWTNYTNHQLIRVVILVCLLGGDINADIINLVLKTKDVPAE